MSDNSTSTDAAGVSGNLMIAALLSTTLISLAPNLLLFLFPSLSSSSSHSKSWWLTCGQALAAGGLLGDVFLHTLAHHDHGDHHDDHDHEDHDDDHESSAGQWVLLGFVIFLIMDMTVQNLEGGHTHHDNEDKFSSDTTKKTIKEQSLSTTTPKILSSTVLLNLTADAMHNFTDGLAIGASYASATTTAAAAAGSSILALLWNSRRGGLATLSILFHEIPHELGDYAILLQHGFTKQQAIMTQFGTAVAALMGTVIGVQAVAVAGRSASNHDDHHHDHDDHEHHHHDHHDSVVGDAIIYTTAGGFLYLSCVSILPTVLEEAASSPSFSRKFSFLLAFLTGIAFMYGVSLMEEADEQHHHDHVMSINNEL